MILQDIQECGLQFQGAIVAYDEGLLSYDKALANSIWRRIFDCKSHDFVKIELLIIYIRKNVCETFGSRLINYNNDDFNLSHSLFQLANLDNIGRDEFLYKPYVKWISKKNYK